MSHNVQIETPGLLETVKGTSLKVGSLDIWDPILGLDVKINR